MKKVEIFIPGKVMLAGEYAVLRGGHALAATLSHGMTVQVEWDPQAARWEINSNLWSELRYVADDHTPQIDMLCRTVQFMAKRTGMHGGRVTVRSEIEIKHGIGSSSALRLGVCAAFLAIKNGKNPDHAGGVSLEAAHAAWQLQSEGQGIASGYDIMSQYVGGLVEFTFEYENGKWKPQWFRHDTRGLEHLVHVFIGGKGAPTGETTQSTSSWLESSNRFEKLLDISESLVDAFNLAILWPEPANIRKLNAAVGMARALFSPSPHFPEDVAMALAGLPGLDSSWSWKTTGAGGEDALLLVGTRHAIQPAAERLWATGWHRLDHEFANAGARIVSLSSDGGDDVSAPPHVKTSSIKNGSSRASDYLRGP